MDIYSGHGYWARSGNLIHYTIIIFCERILYTSSPQRQWAKDHERKTSTPNIYASDNYLLPVGWINITRGEMDIFRQQSLWSNQSIKQCLIDRGGRYQAHTIFILSLVLVSFQWRFHLTQFSLMTLQRPIVFLYLFLKPILRMNFFTYYVRFGPRPFWLFSISLWR